VGLRHLFASKFLPLMGKLCTEELDIAVVQTAHVWRKLLSYFSNLENS